MELAVIGTSSAGAVVLLVAIVVGALIEVRRSTAARLRRPLSRGHRDRGVRR